jgi:protein SCO1/2
VENMEKRFLVSGVVVLGFLVLASAGFILWARADQGFRGSVVNPPAPAADFALTNQTGQTTKLSDFRGRYVLLFFGYTNCPNECPATMAVLKLVHIDLGNQAGKVQVLFVSTDPARDTPQAVGAFVGRFDRSFIGLTGTQAELAKVWAEYGVTVENGGETHSTYVYLIDPTGNLRLTYASINKPDDILADLWLLFREG